MHPALMHHRSVQTRRRSSVRGFGHCGAMAVVRRCHTCRCDRPVDLFLICSKNCNMCKNEWGSMKRAAQKKGLLHAYRWLRKEADWKLALESLVAFKKFRDEWDFTFKCFPFVEWVPADVLLAKPPTLMAVLLNLNPGPVVPANSEDPWPLSDVDKRRVRCRRA